MEQMRRALEELFSDFSPPSPDGEVSAEPKSQRMPSSPAPRVEASPPAKKTPPTDQREAFVEYHGLAAMQVRNIRAQLLGNALIILIVTLWVAFLAAGEMVRLNQAAAILAEETARANAALVAGEKAAALLTTIGYGTTQHDTQNFVQSLEEASASLKEAQDHLRESIAPLPVQDPVWSAMSRLQAAVAQMDSWTFSLMDLARRGQWDTIRSYQMYLFPYYSSEISGAIAEIDRVTGERLARANTEMAVTRTMLRNVALAWGGFLVLVILGVNALLLPSVAEPVENMTRAAAQLAAGHLETRVPIGRADEFGRLAQAFNEMADRLQAYYAELEERVAERTRALQEANYALQRRAIQLEAAAEVSRAITSIFNVDELLRRAVNLIRDRFGFYHAGIFLMDEAGEWAVLREATGEAGAQMKAQGHRLRMGETSMVGWTAFHHRPRVALDVGEDAVHFANPLLPYTRSEMTLPLMVGGRLLGVLDVQSTEEAAFDEDDVRTLQSMADQLAIAIENARRLSETAALLEATSPIYRFSRRMSTAATVNDVADAIIEAVSETEADGCVVMGFESSDGVPEMVSYLGTWRRDQEPMFPPGVRMAVTEASIPITMLSRMWVSEDVQRDSGISDKAREFFRATGMGAMVSILLRVGDRAIGQIVILRSTPGPFSPASLRLYEVIGDQAAVALERARLLESMRQRAEQEEALRSIADRIAATFDLRTALQTTLQQLGQVLDARGGYAELGTR